MSQQQQDRWAQQLLTETLGIAWHDSDPQARRVADAAARILCDQRTLPHDMALVPREITAETGHKAGMIGDFEQWLEETCPDCEGEDWEDGKECELCEGSGQLAAVITVSWTTIKAIHRRIVEIAEGKPS